MTQELRRLAERLAPTNATVSRIDADRAGLAILSLLDRLEKAEEDAADLAMLADQYKAERDALQAKLDELQRQEPVIDFTVLHQFASDQAISYNKLCTTVRMCLAAPKALDPLTESMRKDIAMQCAKLDWDDDYSASVGKVIDAAEAAHGIGGTPKALTDCRIELVTAIHTLASHYENRLHRLDADDRKLAEGDIAHAIKIASKWNWNGITKGTPT